jgi:outer membrane protein TolC
MSLTVQQNYPLSHVRGHRRDAAEAEAHRALAQVARVDLDVELDAAVAFWMLFEIRETGKIVGEQRALAAKMVDAALGRYAASTGAEADVLRA